MATDVSLDTTNDCKGCVYCGTTMALMASICPTCKSYQDRWRNILLFIGAIAGAITLGVGILSFAVNQGVTAFKTAFWRDSLAVLEFEAEGLLSARAIVANKGDGPLLLSVVQVFLKNNSNKTYQFNRPLEKETVSEIASIYWKRSLRLDGFLGTRTGIPTAQMRDLASTAFSEECIHAKIFSPDHPDLVRVKNHYDKFYIPLAVEQATALAFFYSAQSGVQKQVEFPVTVTYLRRNDGDCRNFVVLEE